MIEPTDAPAPTDNKATLGDDKISSSFSLQKNKPYQFKRNEGSGGIRVRLIDNLREAMFDIDPDFKPSQVSVLELLVTVIYFAIVINYLCNYICSSIWIKTQVDKTARFPFTAYSTEFATT
jgi:hypothetical protein